MSLMTTVAALTATKLKAVLRHNLRLATLYGVAGLSTLGAIGFGLSALHRVLEPLEGAIGADLIIGAGLLFLAGILIGVAQFLIRRARRRATLASIVAAAPLAAGLMAKSPKIGLAAIAIALVIGGLAGRSVGK